MIYELHATGVIKIYSRHKLISFPHDIQAQYISDNPLIEALFKLGDLFIGLFSCNSSDSINKKDL